MPPDSDNNPAAIPEPAPVPNDGASMHDLVIEDLRARKQFGLQKYGTILQAHNGRDPLNDAYQEVLDCAVYLRQAIIERAALLAKLAKPQLPGPVLDLLNDAAELLDTAASTSTEGWPEADDMARRLRATVNGDQS